MTAAGVASTIKGAESTAQVDESVQAAKDLAKRLGCVVAVSGAVDYVRPTLRGYNAWFAERVCNKQPTAVCSSSKRALAQGAKPHLASKLD